MTADLYTLAIEGDSEPISARLGGEIDSSNAAAVQERLLENARGRHLRLDLSAVEYFDSSGMAMLNTLFRQTQLELIIAPGSIIARALEIVGLSDKIPIHHASPE